MPEAKEPVILSPEKIPQHADDSKGTVVGDFYLGGGIAS